MLFFIYNAFDFTYNRIGNTAIRKIQAHDGGAELVFLTWTEGKVKDGHYF